MPNIYESKVKPYTQTESCHALSWHYINFNIDTNYERIIWANQLIYLFTVPTQRSQRRDIYVSIRHVLMLHTTSRWRSNDYAQPHNDQVHSFVRIIIDIGYWYVNSPKIIEVCRLPATHFYATIVKHLPNETMPNWNLTLQSKFIPVISVVHTFVTGNHSPSYSM